MPAQILKVETFIVALPRDVPYLGPLGEGETVNERGYFVRRGNRTIYPTVDRSVLVRNCASWSGLDDCLRVTLGTASENDAFLAALAASLEDS